MRVKFEVMKNEFERILLSKGFTPEIAFRSAELFTQNSLDGVYSHGVYRFPRVVSYIEQGFIDPAAVPTVELDMGCFQRWNGNLAMGNTTAHSAMARAIELAQENVVGVVAVGNTNHWMRGGAYGWQAADAGMIGMCWTNTMPNMPAWGTKERNIGNNPFVLAIPRSNKEHVVVDCAMSQFSYGKIGEYRQKGAELPVAGGYNSEGKLTSDPIEIEKTWRVLPAGFWKGSGLSIALDLVAAVLSGANSTTGVGKKCGMENEYGLSQVFLAVDAATMNPDDFADRVIDEVLASIKGSEMADDAGSIMYPGERVVNTRRDNLQNGIPVIDDIWEKIKSM